MERGTGRYIQYISMNTGDQLPNEVEKSLAKEATKDSNRFIVETRFESKRAHGTEIANGDHDQAKLLFA